jgi:cytochrome c oxidase subunit 2
MRHRFARLIGSFGAGVATPSVYATPADLGQTALDHAAQQGSRITGLWWFYFAVLIGVFTLVIAAMLTAVAMHRHSQEKSNASVPIQVSQPQHESRSYAVVLGATLVTVVILFGLLLMDVLADREVSSPAPENALVIKVTGHQWWWELRYESRDPSEIVKTANELHIPTNVPVKFELNSVDVIHSFWVPNLHGKKDLIPGHPTNTWFVAKRPGIYYGQCAEFCGYQHAHMRLVITAEPQQQFDDWLERQRQAAPEPANDQQRRGLQVFTGGTCVMCHSVQGTPARASVGPDLTHFASRQWLGAGALPNTAGDLAQWIRDPQAHKPGVRMPQHPFNDPDLNALVAYLETLK